ncbi:septum formation initiator family protein [Desulfitobacterium sp. Sab5]
MMNKSQPEIKKSKKKHQFSFGRLIILTFLVTTFTTSGWKLFLLQQEVNGKVAELESQKQTLLEEKSGLEQEIVRLNTPSYIEQLAREQLGLVRKGEIMISPKKQ